MAVLEIKKLSDLEYSAYCTVNGLNYIFIIIEKQVTEVISTAIPVENYLKDHRNGIRLLEWPDDICEIIHEYIIRNFSQ